MRISVEQLNGETLDLEVKAEMTMREVKRKVKAMQMWEDAVSRDTTVVEVLVGDKKVKSDETVAELGLSSDSKVAAVFRQNVARCSKKSGFGQDLDPDALVVVEIPDSETEIEPNSFRRCTRVAKVIIPSSVTRIGHLAFCDCSSLTAMNIPDSVTQICDGAFEDCCSLVAVAIPESVTRIPHSAFKGCKSLKRITIPDSVTRIEPQAFSGCTQLTLTAPARLFGAHIGFGCKMVSKEIVDAAHVSGDALASRVGT